MKNIISNIKIFIKHLFIELITIITFIPKYIIIGFQSIFSKNKKEELKNQTKKTPNILIALSLITYLICVFILSRWYVQNERNKKFSDSLISATKIVKEKEDKITNEYKNLTFYSGSYPDDLNFLNINLGHYIKINNETVAWIQVNGTNISYPVVQHNDNKYYLQHDFYKRKTDVGWVFADYRDNFNDFNNNTIIYAHNLVNRTMFGQLPFLLRNNWQSNPNYHYIKISAKKTNSIWKIFSVYRIKPTTDYLQSKFNSAENYYNFLTTIKNRSAYNFNTDVAVTDKIITLSTCDDIGTHRIVVHGKLVGIEKK